MNYKTYLEMSPLSLLENLSKTFLYKVDETIETPADLQKISGILVQTTNEFSFLSQLLNYAKFDCRYYKRLGKDYKTQYEDAIDRREVVHSILDAVELRYKTLSRMITIKQEINKELKMSA